MPPVFEPQNASAILKKLLSNYDKRLRPGHAGNFSCFPVFVAFVKMRPQFILTCRENYFFHRENQYHKVPDRFSEECFVFAFCQNHLFSLRTTFFFSERPVDIAIDIGVLSISNIEEENMVSQSSIQQPESQTPYTAGIDYISGLMREPDVTQATRFFAVYFFKQFKYSCILHLVHLHGIQDSLGFYTWNPLSGIQILDSNRQWDSRSLELYSGFQSPGFRIPQGNISGFRFPQAKISWISKSRFSNMVRLQCST